MTPFHCALVVGALASASWTQASRVPPMASLERAACTLEAADGLLRRSVAQDPDPARLMAAIETLEATPTGGPLAAQVDAGTARVELNGDGDVDYQDGAGLVRYAKDFLDGSELWQNAVILGHELEHARQDAAGVRGTESRAAREAAAFLVQSRVWVELGGKVRQKDWAANGMNSRDMAAWLNYPMSSAAAIAARSGWTLIFADEKARAYWNDVIKDEAAWRRGWASKYPALDSRGAALFILNQAVSSQYQSTYPVSAWLPGVLEKAAALGEEKMLDLPEEPNPSDRILLTAMGFKTEGARLIAPALPLKP